MSALEPRIEAIRQQYGLLASDFWQISQNKQWVCKHAALEVVAVKAKIKFDLPVVIEKDAAGLVTSMVVMGHMGDRSEWATGETNPTNYSVKGKQPAYPWAMSEKRAKDRVILKLVGIHGLVYSEDELAPEPPANASAAEQKRSLAEIDRELLDCASVIAVDKCADGWKHIATRDGWSKDYKLEAAKKFQARRQELTAVSDFPGDLPSGGPHDGPPTRNGYLDNMRAG